MQVLNNYDECLTNLGCSMRRYFGLEYHHKTLPEVDQVLDEKQPEKVALILLDGLGSRILERNLSAEAFLRKNKVRDIYSVFPATTTAATTSVRTGLNPVEHGWLGWTVYIEPIDKVITLFLEQEKGHEEVCRDFLTVKEKYRRPLIGKEIARAGQFDGEEILSFKGEAYEKLDAMLAKVEKEAAKPGKRYIYGYNREPDVSMHDLGVEAPEIRALIEERNDKLEALAGRLHDTLLIVVADHGHLTVENVFLEDYPDILELLAKPASLDQRAAVYHVKPGKKAEFREKFERYFGDFYRLYDSEDVIESKLFGDGEEHEYFRPALGDFVAIAYGNKCLVAPGDSVLKSQHAGYTENEILVPLILKYCE